MNLQRTATADARNHTLIYRQSILNVTLQHSSEIKIQLSHAIAEAKPMNEERESLMIKFTFVREGGCIQ